VWLHRPLLLVNKRMNTVFEKELVSVIIPVHNRFGLAEQAIKSVLGQSYRPLEIIVVDDASAEPFRLAMEQASDVEFRLIRLELNSGPGAAREAGRKQARGEFIAYLDSDDLWAQGFLAEMTCALRQTESAGMVYCSAIYSDSGGGGEFVKRSNQRFETFLPTVLWGRPWPTCGCVWRRWATDRIGPWLPIWWWEDYEYDCRAGRLGIGICHVPTVLCTVHRDAPKRISEVLSSHRAVESMELAMGEIAEHAASVGLLRDGAVRSRVAERMLGIAIAALKISEFGRARSNIYSAIHRAQVGFVSRLWGYCALALVALQNRKLALQVTRRLRSHLIGQLQDEW